MFKKRIMAGAMALMMPLTMCLTGCSFVSMFNTFSYQYDNAMEYKPGDRDFDEKITKINLDYVSGDVKIKTADTDKVSVKETANIVLRDPQKVHTWVNEGTLYVRFCQSLKKINFTNINKSLELTLPESQDLDDVIISMSSGNLGCEGFTTDNLKIHSSSGGVGMTGSARNIEIKASSGNIYLDQTGDSENITLKASSGKIDVKQSGSCSSMAVNSSSGSVTVDADKVTKLDVHVSSGNIKISGNEITELISKASSGNNTFDFATAPKTSTINSSSGWVEIRMPEDSDITLRAKLSSGEFNSEMPFSKNGKEYTSGNGSSTMDIKVSSGDVRILKK